MAIAKKVLISYIVGGVGLAGGAAGLAIGLTKKPEEIPIPVPTEGFNVKLHYNDESVDMPGALIELKEAPSVPKDWIKKEDHLAAVGWYFDKELTNSVSYPYTVTEDTDLFLKTEIGMGKVYLHTTEDPTSSTYNGTEDWYYANQYASQGNGFLKRDLPDKAHYKKLGWALTRTDFGSEASWPEPTKEGVVKDWPTDGIRPEINRIAHLYPMYEQIDFQITFDTNGGNAISPIWSNGSEVPEVDQPDDPILANNEFQGWVYAENYDDEHKIDTPIDWTKINQDMTFKAKWETVAWRITLNEVVGTASEWSPLAAQGGVTTLTPGALKDALEKVEDRDGYAPAGWSLEEHDLGTHWEPKDLITGEISITENTDLYVMYYSKDMSIKINLNGAKLDVGGMVYSESYNLSTYGRELTNAGELYNELEEVGTITAPQTSPNFVGWEEKDSTTLITYPYILSSGTTELTMVWTDTSKFSITFDAAGGEFYYEKDDKIVKTTPLITYTVDLNDTTLWTLQHKPTITNVYQEALEEWECIATNPLRREGYVDNSETPWSVAGAPVSNPDNYLLTGSATISKVWIAETSSGSWDQDSFALICAIAEDTTPTGDPNYPTQLEKTYNTKATEFVGKTKEISIPLLDPDNTFTVRVIGVNKDFLSNGDNQKAYLTFEFVDCPMASCYAPDGAARDARYNNSMVKKISLPYLINIMPASLTSHFQMVEKVYLTNSTTKTAVSCTTLETETTNLFILSAYEYGGSTTGSASIEAGKSSSRVFRYDYYNFNDDGNQAKRAHTLNGSNSPVWTRTPSGGISKQLTDYDVCFIGEVGGANPNKLVCYDPVYGYGVAPAFCIGVYPAQ